MDVSIELYESFSSGNYIFHRVLVDSLNTALMEDLPFGKKWVELPWRERFRRKALQKTSEDHVKMCLERAINMVSNWGEYGMARLEAVEGEEVNEEELRQYAEEKIALVAKEEALEEDLSSQYHEAGMLFLLENMVFEGEIHRLAIDLQSMQNR